MTDSAKRLLYRVEEAADMLSIGRTKVFELIRTGELRSVTIARSRRIPADALGDYIEALELREAS